MESNHRPSLAGTVFKTACAPCAPSSVVGAERIELPTSCSQSKRATAALRPENGCWQHSAPGHSLECVLADERPLLPTSKRAGLDTGYRKSARACSVPEPCPPRCTRFPGMGAARLLRVLPRRRFDVGPRLSGVSCHLSPSDLSRNRTAPFLPSLDRRAGIEPALSLLVAGGDPGFPITLST